MEGRTRLTGETLPGKTIITLGDLRDAISDEHLYQLLEGTFQAETRLLVRTAPNVCSTFAEDCFTTDLVFPKRRRKQVVHAPPSARYEKEWKEYQDGKRLIDAPVILGLYFKEYRRLYGEEDPEWSGKSSRAAEIIVAKMVQDVGVDAYEVLMYLKRIMPRWHARLVSGAEFPDTRPTIKALFRSKHFWANRKVYFHRWAMP